MTHLRINLKTVSVNLGPSVLARSEGRQPLGAVLHLSDELGDLSQWLCYHDSTRSIVM